MRTALAGMDSRLDARGVLHPWRLVIHEPVIDVTIHFIGPLPFDATWVSVPRDALYGDLVGLPGGLLDGRAYDIVGHLGQKDIAGLRLVTRRGGIRLLEALEIEGMTIEIDDAADAALVGSQTQSSIGIAGNAGTEIEALLMRGSKRP